MNTGVIYKIELNENNIYIGSTTQKLCKRQSSHNFNLKTKPHRKLYKLCIENNITNIKCVWVADVTFNSNAELRMIEEKYRKELNGNLNSYKCYRSKEDRKEYEKKRKKEKKEYNKKHKKIIKCDKCDCTMNKSSLKKHQKSNKCKLLSECIFSD
tara:strand:- start:36 stop:500 length:465 start_codon:yes stop_codon:yes gene_type:complete